MLLRQECDLRGVCVHLSEMWTRTTLGLLAVPCLPRRPARGAGDSCLLSVIMENKLYQPQEEGIQFREHTLRLCSLICIFSRRVFRLQLLLFISFYRDNGKWATRRKYLWEHTLGGLGRIFLIRHSMLDISVIDEWTRLHWRQQFYIHCSSDLFSPVRSIDVPTAVSLDNATMY